MFIIKNFLYAIWLEFALQPDLPARIKKNIPLAPYDRSAFYTPGNPKGYSDYEFADAETESNYKTSIITRVWIACVVILTPSAEHVQ